MTPAQQRFVELERKKEQVKLFFDELAAATEAVIKEMGINAYFADDQNIVYKTIIPDGKFVKYEKYSYERTKRPGETRGSLSVKEAEENGFKLK